MVSALVRPIIKNSLVLPIFEQNTKLFRHLTAWNRIMMYVRSQNECFISIYVESMEIFAEKKNHTKVEKNITKCAFSLYILEGKEEEGKKAPMTVANRSIKMKFVCAACAGDWKCANKKRELTKKKTALFHFLSLSVSVALCECACNDIFLGALFSFNWVRSDFFVLKSWQTAPTRNRWTSWINKTISLSQAIRQSGSKKNTPNYSMICVILMNLRFEISGNGFWLLGT